MPTRETAELRNLAIRSALKLLSREVDGDGVAGKPSAARFEAGPSTGRATRAQRAIRRDPANAGLAPGRSLRPGQAPARRSRSPRRCRPADARTARAAM